MIEFVLSVLSLLAYLAFLLVGSISIGYLVLRFAYSESCLFEDQKKLGLAGMIGAICVFIGVAADFLAFGSFLVSGMLGLFILASASVALVVVSRIPLGQSAYVTVGMPLQKAQPSAEPKAAPIQQQADFSHVQEIAGHLASVPSAMTASSSSSAKDSLEVVPRPEKTESVVSSTSRLMSDIQTTLFFRKKPVVEQLVIKHEEPERAKDLSIPTRMQGKDSIGKKESREEPSAMERPDIQSMDGSSISSGSMQSRSTSPSTQNPLPTSSQQKPFSVPAKPMQTSSAKPLSQSTQQPLPSSQKPSASSQKPAQKPTDFSIPQRIRTEDVLTREHVPSLENLQRIKSEAIHEVDVAVPIQQKQVVQLPRGSRPHSGRMTTEQAVLARAKDAEAEEIADDLLPNAPAKSPSTSKQSSDPRVHRRYMLSQEERGKTVQVRASKEVAEKEEFNTLVSDVYTQMKDGSPAASKNANVATAQKSQSAQNAAMAQSAMQGALPAAKKKTSSGVAELSMEELLGTSPVVGKEEQSDSGSFALGGDEQPLAAEAPSSNPLFAELEQINTGVPAKKAAQSAQPQMGVVKIAKEDDMSCPTCKTKSARIVFCPYCGTGLCAQCSPSVRVEADKFVYACPKCHEEIDVKKKGFA